MYTLSPGKISRNVDKILMRGVTRIQKVPLGPTAAAVPTVRENFLHFVSRAQFAVNFIPADRPGRVSPVCLLSTSLSLVVNFRLSELH